MRDIMKEDQLDISVFESKSLDASCAHGAYWEIISMPKDVLYDFVNYNDKDTDLLNPHYLIPG